ncbi:DUF5017 domain-containing protein [Chitinophaga cymbidii]|uniref:DUF5017 domain-containing protein n=1 Tax=Chitinophaga cymbidii TaxID=1096750 RepID=A0A512RFB0_9BACT|nr:DUF5017 domain-containing protein [Chitinophaga cymbidii]GEP94396.1 hypothetical protein CCY01nite_06560 [Chitinophaga cymbidii]
MRKAFIIPILLTTVAACTKEKVTTPGLEVSTSSLTYKAGDTVTFNLRGNPDNITFYSGEPGHNYEFRDRTRAENDLLIDFTSLVQFGEIRQNLQLMISTDFTGVADSNAIKAATWTDLSDQVTFSSGADRTPSGTLNLKDYAVEGKLIYVAFRYTDYKKEKGQNRWVIRTFNAQNISPDSIVTPLATVATGGWQAVDFKNYSKKWVITTAQLLMESTDKNGDDNEDWIFAKGFDPFAIKPDEGTALKNISTVLSQHQHVYKKPGTYKVVFDVSSVRYNGEKRAQKEIILTITN